MTYRTRGILSAFVVYVCFAATVRGQITEGPISVGLSPVVELSVQTGIGNSLTDAGDGSGRLFIAGRHGTVEVIQDNQKPANPFLDLSAVGVRVTQDDEGGLMDIAFHPNYDGSLGTSGAGKFYTYTLEPRGLLPPDYSQPELIQRGGGNVHSVIREWTVNPDNPNVVDSSIRTREIIRIDQPQRNNNGGALAFGPDNYLYVSVGDGGGGNDASGRINNPTDGHTNPQPGVTHGNAQDMSNIYGSILRIDPVGSNSTNELYGIPDDNPFVGAFGLDEIYAYGFRNPTRISFDQQTGDLYTGDVGQAHREEVDLVTAGGNYGWVVKEGTRLNFRGGFDTSQMIDPIAEYGRSEGVGIVGGFVYRGSGIPELAGNYVFADEGTSSGRLFYLDPADPVIRQLGIDPLSSPITSSIASLGQDEAGEIYVMFDNRQVARITSTDTDTDTGLQAGDANQDLRFDQMDIVKVSQANKFLSGQPATWGEGDWNGAPGGEPGSPPAGDNLFNQLDIIAALRTGLYLSGPYAASTQSAGEPADTTVEVTYDANSGEIVVASQPGDELTSVNIESASGIFLHSKVAAPVSGVLDVADTHNIVKATFEGGFETLSLGTVAQPGLAEQFIRNDLSVTGSALGGRSIDQVDFVYITPVPEPVSATLMVLGALCAVTGMTLRMRANPDGGTQSRQCTVSS